MGGDSLGQFAFWLAVGFGFLGLTFGPIGRAIGVVLEAVGRRVVGAPRGGSGPELEALSRRVEDLEALGHRLLEVEERLDFAERLLTSGPPPRGPEADTPPEPVDAVG